MADKCTTVGPPEAFSFDQRSSSSRCSEPTECRQLDDYGCGCRGLHNRLHPCIFTREEIGD